DARSRWSAHDLAGDSARGGALAPAGHARAAGRRCRVSGDRNVRRLALSGRGPARESTRHDVVGLSARRALVDRLAVRRARAAKAVVVSRTGGRGRPGTRAGAPAGRPAPRPQPAPPPAAPPPPPPPPPP